MLPLSNLALRTALGATLLVGPPAPGPTSYAAVSGRLKVIDRGGQTAPDVQQAVVFLLPAHGAPPAMAPGRADITTENRTFSPHITVVTVGSTVRFPNRDGFNHNVFSLTEGNAFDLGLYDRGEGKTTVFANGGVVNVFCNVHSTMSAIVVVRNTPWFAQPSVDGSFTIGNVPPGEYVLHLWHERAPESLQNVTVTSAGLQLPDLQLDARTYVQREHLNKFGRPYARTGRRY
jgi:plastocyanin